MDHHVDLAGGQAKQPGGFDDLECLVPHGGRGDWDPWAHAPGGVVERFLRRDRAEGRERAGAERTSRSGQNDPAHLVTLSSTQTLPDGRMYRIDWSDCDSALTGTGHDNGTCGHEGFLVGEGDILARVDGGECRLRPCKTYHGDHQRLDRGPCGDHREPFGPEYDLPGKVLKQGPESLSLSGIHQRDNLGTILPHLGGESFDIAGGRQCCHTPPFWESEDDRQSAS